MRKIRVRYLEQLGHIKRIEVLGEGLFVVHTSHGRFYAKSNSRGYNVFTTEKVFENLKCVKEGRV